MFVAEFNEGEPLPPRSIKVTFNLKQAFIAAVVIAGSGLIMAQASKLSGPYMMPLRSTSLSRKDYKSL